MRFPGNHQGRNEDRRNTAKPRHLRPEPSLVNALRVNQKEFCFHQGNYASDILLVRRDSGVSPFTWVFFIHFYKRSPWACRWLCSPFGCQSSLGRDMGQEAQLLHPETLSCMQKFQNQTIVNSEGNYSQSHRQVLAQICFKNMFFDAINCRLDLLSVEGSYLILIFQQVKLRPEF